MTKSDNECIYYFGIDIGGTSVKAGLFKEDGTLEDKSEFPTSRDEGGSHILNDIAEYIKKEMQRRKLASEQVGGIGLGVPGSVLPDGSVNKCVNLGWGVLNPRTILQEMTGCRVCVGNDANMAALGEYWYANNTHNCSSLLFVTLGTGVGGGVIINGKPLNGYNGAAAEIGHLPVVWDETESCNCGKKGCLEQVASATGVVRTAGRLMNESDEPSSLRSQSYISAKIIFDEAKKGDLIALRTIDRVTEYLGIGIACAAGMVDPELIIIGGGMAAAGDFLIERITDSYMRHVFHPGRNIPIVLAKLGNDAGMYGAARLIMTA